VGIYADAEEDRGGAILRTQDCREKVEWICEHCGLSEGSKRKILNALKEGEANPQICGLSTHAIQPLIQERDPEIKEKAILHIENFLNRKTPQGGQYNKPPTEKQVREIIDKVKEQKSIPTFNATNDNIEWAKWSWNPVTGCLHGCPYCYARDIANRFYKEKFVPTFRPERLDAPKNTKVPDQAKTDTGYKNVFVCSMADLFGDWVPKEWIDAVLNAVRDNPQWNFLFLTKNPKRYLEFTFPNNSWIGTTVDCQERVMPAWDVFSELYKRRDNGSDDEEFASVFFLSCEPFLSPLSFPDMSVWNWIIIGGCSESSGHKAEQPEWDWVWGLLKQIYYNPFDPECPLGTPVYFKPNLTVRPREYPEGY
jgi:protein gp37